MAGARVSRNANVGRTRSINRTGRDSKSSEHHYRQASNHTGTRGTKINKNGLVEKSVSVNLQETKESRQTRIGKARDSNKKTKAPQHGILPVIAGGAGNEAFEGEKETAG